MYGFGSRLGQLGPEKLFPAIEGLGDEAVDGGDQVGLHFDDMLKGSLQLPMPFYERTP